MHIYEIMPSKGPAFNDHLVVAKNEENAKSLVVDMLNMSQTAVLYKTSDFAVSDPIDPDNYFEETVIN